MENWRNKSGTLKSVQQERSPGTITQTYYKRQNVGGAARCGAADSPQRKQTNSTNLAEILYDVIETMSKGKPCVCILIKSFVANTFATKEDRKNIRFLFTEIALHITCVNGK